jgi:hypothetical protein
MRTALIPYHLVALAALPSLHEHVGELPAVNFFRRAELVALWPKLDAQLKLLLLTGQRPGGRGDGEGPYRRRLVADAG